MSGVVSLGVLQVISVNYLFLKLWHQRVRALWIAWGQGGACRRRLSMVLRLSLLLPGIVLGQADGVQTAAPLEVSQAWVRLMPPGRDMTAVYFQLNNLADRAVEILGVSTDWAASAELHQTLRQARVLRMLPLDNAVLAPGASLVFEPGGRHVMLMGIKVPLTEGRAMPLRLSYRFLENSSQTARPSQVQEFLAVVARTSP